MTGAVKRDYLIDTFRGLMLVIMTLDHTRLFTRRYTYQSFGFFGADIGFVFLSGLVFGLVYSRYISSSNELWYRSLKRNFLIYKYQVLIFFILFLEFFLLNYLGNVDDHLLDQLNALFSSPENVIKYFLLLYQPSYLDILPMYILFIFLSPAILKSFAKGQAKTVLAISFVFWAAMQFPFMVNVYLDVEKSLGLQLSTFIFPAWQFLFILGLYLGYSKRLGKSVVPYSRNYMTIAVVIALLIFVIRHLGDMKQWEFVRYFLDNRRNLMLPRLFSFLVVVFIIGGMSRSVVLKKRNYLTFLGQYSIDVYTFHLFLAFPLLIYRDEIMRMDKVYQFIIAMTLGAVISIPAIIKERRKMNKVQETPEPYMKYLVLLVSFPRDAIKMLGNFRKSDGKILN